MPEPDSHHTDLTTLFKKILEAEPLLIERFMPGKRIVRKGDLAGRENGSLEMSIHSDGGITLKTLNSSGDGVTVTFLPSGQNPLSPLVRVAALILINAIDQANKTRPQH